MEFIKFWIIFIAYTAITIGFFFGFSKNGYCLRKEGKVDKWSEEKKKKVNLIVISLSRIISIIFLVFLVFPMAMDIPEAIEGTYSTTFGRVTANTSYMGTRSLRQRFTIDTVDTNHFSVYFGPILKEGDQVTVHYLSHSRFVVELTVDE